MSRPCSIATAVFLLLCGPRAIQPADAESRSPSDPRALAKAAATPVTRAPDEVVVRLAANHLEERSTLADDHGLQLVRDYRQLHVLRFRVVSGRTIDDALARLRSDARVQFAQPNYVYAASSCPSDPSLLPQQWGVFATLLPSLWRPGNGGSGKVIAFLDTGVDAGHPELAAGLWTNGGEVPGNSIDDDSNGYVDDVNGWDFVNDDNSPSDDNGHGTHVTGIACARANNGIGIAGVAHNATHLPLKVLNASGTGVSTDIAAALQYAANKGPSVINMSLTVAATPFEPDADCIVREQIATALAAGCVLVGASGNNGGSSVKLPAAFPGVISVGSINSLGAVSGFSNHGDDLDVVAPGEGVYSTLPGGGFGSMSGTSQATPFVSGVCALLLEKFPATKPWEMESYVRTLTRDLDGRIPGESGNLDGYGLISFGSLSDYSNGSLPAAWSLDDFFEFLGSDVTGESSINDNLPVGADDGDDDMPDLDGIPNSSGHDGRDDGLFNASISNLPLLPTHLYFGNVPPLSVNVGVGDFLGNRWDAGATLTVRGWTDWNSDNLFADPAERLLSTVSGPRAWGANAITLTPAWTPNENHFRGNPMRFRMRVYGPGAAAGGSTGVQNFGEVEDQAVLNFVEDFDTPDFHPGVFADLGAGWVIVADDATTDCYFDPPPDHGLWHMAYAKRNAPCPIAESGDMMIPEAAAAPLDLRELTTATVRLWFAHGVAQSCDAGWHDDCRIVLKRFDALMVPLPDVVLYNFPEPYCPTVGFTSGQLSFDISPYVGGFVRLDIQHSITSVYDGLAIDDVRIFGYDNRTPDAVVFGPSSLDDDRIATVSWTNPKENTGVSPSDPNFDLYGARLWMGGDTWPTAYRLTPRDFDNAASTFPTAGPPGSGITRSLRVPSVFPVFQFGARAQDEVTLEGAVASTPFSAAPTFQVAATALDAVVAADPGDTVKIAMLVTSTGSTLDGVLADATDTRSWTLCPRRWAEVLEPGGAAVESLEVAVPLSAVPSDTDTVFVVVRSLSAPAVQGGTFARVVINGVIGVPGSSVGPPPVLALSAPIPNPFGSTTSFEFSLSKAGEVEIDVFDVAGRRVNRLASGAYTAGRHGVSWNGRNGNDAPLPVGVYFVRLSTAEGVRIRRVMIVR